MVAPLNSLLGSASTAIASGNFASKLSSTSLSGLGSIAGAVSSANVLSSAVASAAGIPALTGNAVTAITTGLGAISSATAALSKISGLPALPNTPSLSSIPGLAGVTDAAKGVSASAFGAITASFKPLKAGVPQNLTAIAKKNAADAAAADAGSTPSVEPLTDAQKKWLGNADPTDPAILARMKAAVPDAGGALAGGSLSSVSGLSVSSVTSALGSVSGAASKISSSVAAIIPGAASGINALPGGLGAISSVVNNAKGAVNSIPGIASITGAIGSATSAVTNGVPAATSSLGSIAGLLPGGASALSKGLGILKAAGSTLSALASTGLSPSASAKMNAAIASISSGGSVPIKIPTVAVNTTDRGELSTGISAVFGNPKIAVPNFSGNPATFGTSPAVAEIDTQQVAINKAYAALDARTAAERVLVDAQTAYKDAERVLPAGDPQLVTLLAAAKAAYVKYSAAFDAATAAAREATS
jgi:hypothetical protein